MTANSGRKARLAFRDGNRCFYCGGDGRHPRKAPRALKGLTIDHVVPLSRGGSNADDNLVLACFRCNAAKANRTPEEWRSA